MHLTVTRRQRPLALFAVLEHRTGRGVSVSVPVPATATAGKSATTNAAARKFPGEVARRAGEYAALGLCVWFGCRLTLLARVRAQAPIIVSLPAG